MSTHTPTARRTPIMVAEADHDLLTDLALAALGKAPGAVLLFEELARAKVVPELPPFVVGMGSMATFTYNDSRYREYELVYPQSADFSKHRISVLTPVGAMLLGLAEGQAIEWTSEDGVTHRIALESVRSNVAAAR
ncbi:MAG TPA: GreA/GreB family elongation factor [Candidatus Binatia bacterium]|nr:GreA/GreB family elongation factor [Candidatus Binatia bacterium]